MPSQQLWQGSLSSPELHIYSHSLGKLSSWYSYILPCRKIYLTVYTHFISILKYCFSKNNNNKLGENLFRKERKFLERHNDKMLIKYLGKYNKKTINSSKHFSWGLDAKLNNLPKSFPFMVPLWDIVQSLSVSRNCGSVLNVLELVLGTGVWVHKREMFQNIEISGLS